MEVVLIFFYMLEWQIHPLNLYTTDGSFHDFIVDTENIKSIVSFKNLEYLDSNVVVQPNEVSVLLDTNYPREVLQTANKMWQFFIHPPP